MILFYKKNSKESEEVIEILKDFENVKYVDVEENKTLAEEYSVKVFPTLIVSTDDDVSEENVFVGLKEIESFLEVEEEDF
ncbi:MULTISPECIES: thioredoxin domain-containing protein [Cetobacterium]|uniref:thioredoxin domain-containing protein n=2 Tax=Fusobacteriaceae TaxID=203492 RepID=UPI001F057EB9|nr:MULTISPECIES: thioredoxin domain-containing protein [Cetobacterium]MCX3066043.1 thioredoxin domain-containing protein [Cetobacterium somerae]UPO96525.1 circadian clock KaiB family protein [Cetobacterium somerae]